MTKDEGAGDRPALEIEITPQMIEAGASELSSVLGGAVSAHWDPDELASAVYRAMAWSLNTTAIAWHQRYSTSSFLEAWQGPRLRAWDKDGRPVRLEDVELPPPPPGGWQMGTISTGDGDELRPSWKPIATAPKDRLVDLWVVYPDEMRCERWTHAWWHDGGWVTAQGKITGDATHWMAVPDPPQ